MYTELIIRPAKMADRYFHPDQVRKLVAKACDGLPIDPLLFNRQTDGKCIQGQFDRDRPGEPYSGIALPPVAIFDGGQGFIRIYTLGEVGRTLMQKCAPTVAHAVARHIGGAYTFDLKEGECNIEPRSTPSLFSIRRLVVAKHRRNTQKFSQRGEGAQDVEDELKTLVIRGLISQARWLHGNGADKLEYRIPDDGSLGFHIAKGEFVTVKIKNNAYASAYKNLIFSMNLSLKGPWYSGLLRSRGYGKIQPYILRRKAA